MIDIYMTSFFRSHMTERAINEIHSRTKKGTFQIHVFDNGSDKSTRNDLIFLMEAGLIKSLHLDSRNTGCRYNKGIFHMMTESTNPYYVVTDNDVYPPQLTPDWLEQMLQIMETHKRIAFLTPQIPPQGLQMPIQVAPKVVYCKAVGNTFKMVRREAFPLNQFEVKLGEFSDDSYVCNYVRDKGWQVAFCRDVYCLHAGQCENWGYTQSQIALDPRKQNYGVPFTYPVDPTTYMPPESMRM